MNFMGMGAPELIVILVIALIIVGPNKLPEIAGTIGKGIRDFRKFQQEMTAEVTKELNLEEEKKEFASLKADIADITGTFKAPLNELTAAMTSEKEEWERQKRDLASTFDLDAALQAPSSQPVPAAVKDTEPETPASASVVGETKATAENEPPTQIEPDSSQEEAIETHPGLQQETIAEPGIQAEAAPQAGGSAESSGGTEPVLESSPVVSAYQPLSVAAGPATGAVATEATDGELPHGAADPPGAHPAAEPQAESPSELAPEEKGERST